jgi:branched-chain amino acid transport system permease protein
VRTVNGFRPGLLLAVVGLIWGLLAFTSAGWFGTGGQRNDKFSDLQTTFAPTGMSGIASQYLSWLGWTLFIGCTVLTLAATYLRHQILGWVAGIASLIAVLLTFLTLKSMTGVAASQAPQFGANWKNLGVGGFVVCMVYTIFAAAAALVIGVARDRARVEKKLRADAQEAAAAQAPKAYRNKLPFSAAVETVRSSSMAKAFLIIGIGFALFYPPTLTVTWQNVLVTQVGSFVLLAIGLNVVVGWAGLLDLGYIAFYEVGAYTTAYLTGRLPVKPPSWLHAFHSPLWSIPFAIVICMIAGVLLGAPTLRLRGDYLAIVTLGFGEIIRICVKNIEWLGASAGINNISHPNSVGPAPKPPFEPGGFFAIPRVEWSGLVPSLDHEHSTHFLVFGARDAIPYYWLLLTALILVLVADRLVKASRVGRAWEATREDEDAAELMGVPTFRFKLIAFAIGAAIGGLSGALFAGKSGFINPQSFELLLSILFLAAVVVGGQGNRWGVILGAIVVSYFPERFREFADFRVLVFGLALMLLAIFRPQGLLPPRRTLRAKRADARQQVLEEGEAGA